MSDSQSNSCGNRTLAHTSNMAPPTQASPQLAPRPFEDAEPEGELAAKGDAPGQHSFSHLAMTTPIQAKLTVGAPGDPYEQEADRIADQVMAISDPASSQVQRTQGLEEEEELQMKPLGSSIQRMQEPEEEELQMKAAGPSQEAGSDLETRLNQAKGGGEALADSARALIEPRMGFDFGNVRVHTDSTAVQMNEQLGARAFTHGNDIYFGAGQYTPESASGQRLLTHELTHVVQQTGGVQAKANPLTQAQNRDPHIEPAGLARRTETIAASASAAISPAAAMNVQAEFPDDFAGLPGFFESPLTSDIPDMQPVNWSELADQSAVFPLSPTLQEVSIAGPIVNSHAPGYVRPQPDPMRSLGTACPPSHHAPRPPVFDSSMLDRMIDLDRQQAWEVFGRDVSAVERGWNATVPLYNAFRSAEQDETLQEAEIGLQTLAPGNSASLDQLAEMQEVPRAGANRVLSVGSLFPSPEGFGARGGRVEVTTRDRQGIDRAANNPDVRQAALAVEAAEARVRTSVQVVRAAVTGVEAAAIDVKEKALAVQVVEARHEEADARENLTDIEDEKQAVADGVEDLITIVKSVVSLGLAGEASDRVDPIADITGVIADRIVDAAYSDQIAAAQRRVDQAVRRLRGLEQQQAESALAASHARLLQAQQTLAAARSALSEPLIERQRAYSELGQVLASQSGGTQSTRDRLAAFALAIPIAEVVIARAANVVSATEVGNVMYTNQSGIGFSMATHTSPNSHGAPGASSSAYAFVNCVAVIRGLRTEMSGVQTLWTERLSSLRAIVRQLRMGSVRPTVTR